MERQHSISSPAHREWCDPMFAAPPSTPSPSSVLRPSQPKRTRSRDLPCSPSTSRPRRSVASPARDLRRAHEGAAASNVKRPAPSLRVLRQNSLPAPASHSNPASAAPSAVVGAPKSPQVLPTAAERLPAAATARAFPRRCISTCESALDGLDAFLLPPPALPLDGCAETPLALVAPATPERLPRDCSATEYDTNGLDAALPAPHALAPADVTSAKRCLRPLSRSHLMDVSANQRASLSPRKGDPMFDFRQRAAALSPAPKSRSNVAAGNATAVAAGCCGAGSSAAAQLGARHHQLPRRIVGTRLASPVRSSRKAILIGPLN